MFNKLTKLLLGGADHNEENTELLDNLTKEQLLELVKKQKDQIEEKNKEIQKTAEEIRKYKIALLERRDRRENNKKSVDGYTDININRWIDIFKAEDAKHQNPEVIQYDEDISTFDLVKSNKNQYFKFRPYQQKFIEDWSISTNELVILYYGVGSGKTLIAINCGEQFINLNPNSYVYFLLPASLVINTIMKMYEVGLDPRRKNFEGEYVYKFISYQQMMLSKVDIKPNSLLIIDEAHNLRNFRTKEISEKKSARKWSKTGNYSLVGGKVAQLLLKNKNSFMRTIMMTGTLFCNNSEDIEPLIGIGYKRAPLINMDKDKLLQLRNDPKQFDRYYGGLISFFRLKDDDPDFPRKKYHFIPIEADMSMDNSKDDPYYQEGRNSGMEQKCNWILKFIKDNPKDKTLLYAEFMEKAIVILMTKLAKAGFNVVEITGSENVKQKQAGIKLYNTHKIQLLVFSKAIKEGISFKETNNFIFIQPYWNYAISEQIIARAVRLDSHKEKQKSLVNIYCLIGVNSNDFEMLGSGSKNPIDKLFNDLTSKKKSVNKNDPLLSNEFSTINCPENLVSKQNEYFKLYRKQEREREEKIKEKKENPSKTIKEWIEEANKIMNDNIKTLEYPREKQIVLNIVRDKHKIITRYFDKKEIIMERKSFFSRDTYIWDMMFNKQEDINNFEKELLEPRLSFENYLTNENNEFVQEYNLELEKLKSEGKDISRKKEIELKRTMYKKNYGKKIEATDKLLQRFANDSKFKENRNPDLQELAKNKYNDVEVARKMKKLFDDGANLSQILEEFNIDKQQITNFQANFTSSENINTIIEMSNIKEDKKNKIFVLEPTSGIGGVISHLLKVSPNKDNLMIDSNEFHNVFFNFQKLLFNGLDNIFVYNTDFMTFESRYDYDYILGNPPFNLRLQQKKIRGKHIEAEKEGKVIISTQKVDDTIIYVDTVLYDVDFVAQAYNLLKNASEAGEKDGGVLCMIISDRYQRDEKHQSFKAFREFIKRSLKTDETSVIVKKTSEFNYHNEKEGTKEMTTSYPMVCIYMRKLFNVNMDLSNKGIWDEQEEKVKDMTKPEDEAEKELEKRLKEIPNPVKAKAKKYKAMAFNLDDELKEEYTKALKKPEKEKRKEIIKPKPKDMRGTRKTGSGKEEEELELCRHIMNTKKSTEELIKIFKETGEDNEELKKYEEQLKKYEEKIKNYDCENKIKKAEEAEKEKLKEEKKQKRKKKAEPEPEPEPKPEPKKPEEREKEIKENLKFMEELEKKGKEKDVPTYEGWDNLGHILSIIFAEKYKLPCVLNRIDTTDGRHPYVYAYEASKCIKKGEKVLLIPVYLEKHLNMLIIKVDTREVLRFEPHGALFQRNKAGKQHREGNRVDTYLKKYTKALNEILELKKTKFNYIKPVDSCPNVLDTHGFQTLDSIYSKHFNTKLKEGGGYCQLWSFFFAECIIKNPEMDMREVYKHALEALEKNPIKTRMIIRGYLHEVNENLETNKEFLSNYIKNVPKVSREYNEALMNDENFSFDKYKREKDELLKEKPDIFKGTGEAFPDVVEKKKDIKFIMPESIYKTQGTGIIDTVKTFFTGRKDFPPSVRKFIEDNKDLKITKLRVGRKPINSLITTIGNTLSFGNLKEAMKKYNYDDLFHLWLEFTMSDGKTNRVEKDEVIKISPVNNRDSEKTNYMDVNIKNSPTVYDFFYKPLKDIGKNFVEYSAHKFNCQHFVMNLLKYSNNLTPELTKFIVQDVEGVLSDPKFSLHKSILKTITGIGERLNILKEGAGKKKY